LLSGEVEEIFLEDFAVAQLRRECIGQRPLAVNRALQGGHDRNAKIAEQVREVDDVCFHALARFRAVELSKEKILHVDDRADAAFGNHELGHRRHPVARMERSVIRESRISLRSMRATQRGISMLTVARTSALTSESAEATGATTR